MLIKITYLRLLVAQARISYTAVRFPALVHVWVSLGTRADCPTSVGGSLLRGFGRVTYRFYSVC